MFIEIGIGLVISYAILFILSLLFKDNSIVDIYWGIGFLQVSLHALYFSSQITPLHIILFAFVCFWALRLSYYIIYKRIQRGCEDPRYRAFREQWRFFYTRSIFQVYILQGILLFIIALPLMFFFSTAQYLFPLWFYLGILIAVIGFIIESVADWQFSKFLKNKKQDDIMNKGLWRYSRHPNYFGESTIWLGITIIGLPLSLFSILSYLTIFTLLRFVSGVPMAEKHLKENPQYRKYMEKTPAFFPRLPKDSVINENK